MYQQAGSSYLFIVEVTLFGQMGNASVSINIPYEEYDLVAKIQGGSVRTQLIGDTLTLDAYSLSYDYQSQSNGNLDSLEFIWHCQMNYNDSCMFLLLHHLCFFILVLCFVFPFFCLLFWCFPSSVFIVFQYPCTKTKRQKNKD